MSSAVPSATPAGTPETTPPIHIDLDDSLGAVLIGLIIAAILFGIINVQTLTYFQNSKSDPKYLKCMIILLWILIASTFAMMTHHNYYVLVTNFTNLSIVDKVTWSWITPILSSEISDFIIRLYYSRRIWILSDRNWFLTIGAVWSISIHSTVTLKKFNVLGFLELCCIWFPLKSLHEISGFSWLMYMSFASGVVADLWTAISVCYSLRKDKSGLQRTDTLINKLTVYIVGTGLLTSVCAMCALITYAAMPNNSIFVAIYSNLAKLYFNALLANLNTRKRLRGDFAFAMDFLDHDLRACQMRGSMCIGTPVISGIQSSSTAERSSGIPFTNSEHKVDSLDNSRLDQEKGDISIRTERVHRRDEQESQSNSRV
ncbi:hypothetical protein ACEPAG_50 [Sanghuangporus baumii]